MSLVVEIIVALNLAGKKLIRALTLRYFHHSLNFYWLTSRAKSMPSGETHNKLYSIQALNFIAQIIWAMILKTRMTCHDFGVDCTCQLIMITGFAEFMAKNVALNKYLEQYLHEESAQTFIAQIWLVVIFKGRITCYDFGVDYTCQLIMIGRFAEFMAKRFVCTMNFTTVIYDQKCWSEQIFGAIFAQRITEKDQVCHDRRGRWWKLLVVHRMISVLIFGFLWWSPTR